MSDEIKFDTTDWNHEQPTEHASTRYENLVFQGTEFCNVNARDLEFVDCEFLNVHLGRTCNWTNCIWRGCKFSGRYATFGGPSHFDKCQFLETEIEYVDFSNARFTDCVFSGVLKNTVFRGDERTALVERGLTTTFTNVDMSDLRFDDVYIRRSFDLSTTKLPRESVQLFNNEDGKFVAALRAALAEAGEARSGLRIYALDIYANQNPLPICDSIIQTYFRTEAGRKAFWSIVEPFHLASS